MNRGLKTLFKTLAALLLLLALVYFYQADVKKIEEEKKAEEQAKKIFSFHKDDINKLILKKGDLEITCEKSNDKWSITSPITAAGDKTAIEAIITGLENANTQRTILEKVTDKSPYGLDPPFASLTVADASGEYTLYLGDKNPTGTYAYAIKEGAPELFLVFNSIRISADKKLMDLRDKKLFDFETKAALRLKIEREADTLVCEKVGEDEWNIIEPLRVPADKYRVSGILSRLVNSQIKEFIPLEEAKLSEYGLINPATRVTVVCQPGETTLELVLGKPNADGTGIYGRRGEEKEILLVNNDVRAELRLTAKEIRDKALLKFEKEDIAKIELTNFTGEHIVVELKEGEKEKWRMLEPLQTEAKDATINSFLWTVKSMRAKDYAEEKATDLTPYGLDNPKITLKLWAKEKEKPLVLMVGNEIKNSTGEITGAYAKREGAPAIMIMEKRHYDELQKTSFDWRDRSILKFDKDKVTQVKIIHSKGKIFLEKDGDEWQAIKPKRAKVENWRVSNLLWDLINLEWQQIVATKINTTAAAYGLQKPPVTVELKEGEKASLILLLGKQLVENEELLYAQVKGDDNLYAVKATILEEIPKELKELQRSNE